MFFSPYFWELFYLICIQVKFLQRSFKIEYLLWYMLKAAMGIIQYWDDFFFTPKTSAGHQAANKFSLRCHLQMLHCNERSTFSVSEKETMASKQKERYIKSKQDFSSNISSFLVSRRVIEQCRTEACPLNNLVDADQVAYWAAFVCTCPF